MALFCGGVDQDGNRLYHNLDNALTISIKAGEVHILWVNGSISRLDKEHPFAAGVVEYLRREGRQGATR